MLELSLSAGVPVRMEAAGHRASFVYWTPTPHNGAHCGVTRGGDFIMFALESHGQCSLSLGGHNVNIQLRRVRPGQGDAYFGFEAPPAVTIVRGDAVNTEPRGGHRTASGRTPCSPTPSPESA